MQNYLVGSGGEGIGHIAHSPTAAYLFFRGAGEESLHGCSSQGIQGRIWSSGMEPSSSTAHCVHLLPPLFPRLSSLLTPPAPLSLLTLPLSRCRITLKTLPQNEVTAIHTSHIFTKES